MFDDIVFELLINQPSIEYFEKNILGVSAYRSIYNEEMNYCLYSNIAKIILNLIEKEMINTVKIFAFDSEKENDISAAYHIKSLIEENISKEIKIDIIPYLGGNYEQFITEFLSVNYMIAVRFHSAILSDLYGIPYLPIAYSNKLVNYVDDNFENMSAIPVEDLQTLDKESIKLCDFENRNTQIHTGHIDSFRKLLSSLSK